jgi:hypothetical protein
MAGSPLEILEQKSPELEEILEQKSPELEEGIAVEANFDIFNL